MKKFLCIFLFCASKAMAITGDVSWEGKLNLFGKKLEGTGAKAEGGAFNDGLLSGEFKVDLSTFKTGDTDRDQHMIEDLGTKDASMILEPLKMGPAKQPFKGSLTIGKTTKPVSGAVTGNVFEFTISLKDFGIKPRTLAGLRIEDAVNVRVVLAL